MNSNADAGGAGADASGNGSGSRSRSHRARRSRANTATRPRESARPNVSGKVREGLKKKLGFYTDMMSQLDMLVFAELCALYYMDCSFFRLLVRAAPHSFFLSPKPEDFVFALDARKPHVLAIAVPGFLCLLAHSLGALPVASEAHRGYLHGGVMIDFVGQTAPASALGLVALDLLILAVQCIMLAMHAEREKLRCLISPIRTAAATSPSSAAATAAVTRAGGTPDAPAAPAAAGPSPAATLQELDAEERGIRPPPAPPPGTGADTGADTPSENPDEDERLHNIDLGGPAGAASPEEAAEHVLDALRSGTNIGDFYVMHALRQAMQEKQGGAAAQSLQSIGYAYTMARLAAERRTRPRAGTVPR